MKRKDARRKGKLNPEAQLQEKPNDFFIVGIGASAGGIQALQEFFRKVPENSGMTYVVILHLSPDHDSQLAAVLQQETKIAVTQVTERTSFKPDHIYVIPPDRHLSMDDGYIAVSPNVHTEDRRAPVDIFFRTLADQHGPRAVSVILSGTGANGSMGLKRVKERGGATFVQNPREAEFSEMPRNAIATGLVDEVLSVSEIPAKIISYRNNTGRVQIIVEAEQRPENQQQALRGIFTLLRQRTGHDFSNYKKATLLRRIERRISVHNLPDLSAYAKYLQDNEHEPTALLKDLLISVTNFFRDKKAFEAIESDIIPQLLQGKNAEDQLRIWVAGCATGEEAYSFAMLCLEKTMGQIDAPKIQIFATDIDEAAIAYAREGNYSINDLADVSPERLQRFFNKEAESYRVRRELRETVMFATHNFLKDPPFSHLDLVSCRNVMIYLNPVAQERVVETFHFALKPGCFLFLGNSESVDGATDLYAAFNREYHIFQSRQVSPRSYPVPESTPALYFDKFKKDHSTQEQEKKILERISFGDLHQQLLEEYAAPSLVVNEEYDILHLTEKVGKYLQIGGGELSQNLLKLVKPELRLELRSALYQAVQRQAGVEVRGLKIMIDDRKEILNIQVRPVLRSGNTAKGFILIVFEPTTDESAKEVVLSSEEPVARQLEEELIKIKAQLRAANEQHDFQAEEMKASNEELQAMNEELRSAAEELETSKEELQSINEELRTVNQELKVKIEETSLASNNLQNLIISTNVGTIFLDRSFRVVLFTPAVRDIFNLRSADYGRPLTDITSSLDYDKLLQDAENVLQKLVEFETEVSTKNGSAYLMRITPYRTDEDRIRGVVITFLNITERRNAEIALRKSEEKYRVKLEQDVNTRTAELNASKELLQAIMDASTDMVQVFKAVRNEHNEIVDFSYVFLNHEAEKWMPNAIGKSLLIMQPGVKEEGIFDTFKQVLESGISNQSERHYVHEQFDGWFFQSVVKMDDGVATTTTDITERKKGELEVLKLKDEIARKATDKYLTLFNSIDQGFALCELVRGENGEGIDYRILELNPMYEKQTGISRQTQIGRTALEVDPELDRWWIKAYTDLVYRAEPKLFEHYDKTVKRWYEIGAYPMQGDQFAILYNDITDRKEREQQQAFSLQLSDALRSLDTPLELQQMACRILRQHLVADRVTYVELESDEDTVRLLAEDETNGLAPLPGNTYKWSTFDSVGHSVAKLGKTIFRDDISVAIDMTPEQKRSFIEVGLRAIINVPLVKAGRLVASIIVHFGQPRRLSPVDIALAEETAERTWAAVEKAKAEQALKENEEEFRSFLTVSSDIVYKMSADWQIMYSLEGKKFLTNTNVTNRSWIDGYIPSHERQRMAQAIERAIKNRRIFELEHQVIDAHGNLAWTFSRAIPLLNEQGEVKEWIGAASNITKRKEAELKLQDFNNRLEKEVTDRTAELHKNYTLIQTIYDTTLIGMAVFAPVRNSRGVITDFRILMVNKKIEKTLGRADISGKMYAELLPGIKKMGLFDLMVKTIETGEPGKMEYHYNYEGIDKWYSTMFVKGGDVLVSTNLDITDRKQSEEDRFRNYVLLQQSEELAGMGSWDYDLLTGRFIWSDGMYRLFNLERGMEITPEIYLEYVTEDCRETANRIIGHIKNGHAEFEETIKIQIGEFIKVIKLKASVVRNENGRPVRVLGVDMDVTSAREAEVIIRKMEADQQLEIFKVTLHTQEEERRRISESLHNGLGQKLFSIKMSLNQLSVQRANENPAEFESSKRHSNELLSDAIRDSRQISHELMPSVLEEYGLEAAVNDLCQQMQTEVKFKCLIELDGVDLDKSMQLAIFRTVQELMLNVVKHAQATKARTEIGYKNQHIQIKVSDDGQGIDPDKQGVNGIGLASIRSKVNLLNGIINIRSEKGTSTTIQIQLPYIPQKTP